MEMGTDLKPRTRIKNRFILIDINNEHNNCKMSSPILIKFGKYAFF